VIAEEHRCERSKGQKWPEWNVRAHVLVTLELFVQAWCT